MPVFPGLPQPSFEPIAKVEDDGYAMTRYAMLNHIGTHVDAPAHQIAGGDTLDEIGLERLVTDALTIDVSSDCSKRWSSPVTDSCFCDSSETMAVLKSTSVLFICCIVGRNSS